MIAFVVLPEALADATADGKRAERTRSHKVMPPELRARATEWSIVSNYGGHLRFSPLFYGCARARSRRRARCQRARGAFFSFYSADEHGAVRYSLPLAYFATAMLVFAYSFFVILRKCARRVAARVPTTKNATHTRARAPVAEWRRTRPSRSSRAARASSTTSRCKQVRLTSEAARPTPS